MTIYYNFNDESIEECTETDGFNAAENALDWIISGGDAVADPTITRIIIKNPDASVVLDMTLEQFKKEVTEDFNMDQTGDEFLAYVVDNLGLDPYTVLSRGGSYEEHFASGEFHRAGVSID